MRNIGYLRSSVSRLVCGVAIAAGLAGGAPAVRADATVPPLADLMTVLQLRHFKLWYAQRVQNWPLVEYELGHFRATLDRIETLYPRVSSAEDAAAVQEEAARALDDLTKAVASQDGPAFEASYREITDTCNACHEATGVGFIRVRVPTSSPFSNQDFFGGTKP